MARQLSESQFPFLAQLSRTGGLEVASLVVTRVARGHPLLTRGDPVDGAYLLVGGALRIYEQRVARLLLRRADAEGLVRASQRQIAAEIGTAREVVFRALRSLSERGLIETGRLRIRVIDALGLRRAGDLDMPRAQPARGREP